MNNFGVGITKMAFIVAVVTIPIAAQNDTIRISSFEELCKIGKDSAHPLDGTYRLTQDIDASESRNMNNALGFEPIGTKEKPFIGNFWGSGHAIKSLYINRPKADNVGLFGYLSDGARLDSVVVNLAFITGRRRVGGFVGHNQRGHVFGCYTDGDVRGAMYIGGLIGYNDGGKVEDSRSTAAVSGDMRFGDLFGHDTVRTVLAQNTGGQTTQPDALVVSNAQDNDTVAAITAIPEQSESVTPEKAIELSRILEHDANWGNAALVFHNSEYRDPWAVVAAGAIIPGGSSFSTKESSIGVLHVVLQVGASITFSVIANSLINATERERSEAARVEAENTVNAAKQNDRFYQYTPMPVPKVNDRGGAIFLCYAAAVTIPVASKIVDMVLGYGRATKQNQDNFRKYLK